VGKAGSHCCADLPIVHGELGASGSSAPRLGCMITQAPHRTSQFETNWCSRFVLISRTVIGVPGDAKNEYVCDFLQNRNGWTGRGNSEKMASVQNGLATHKRMIRARGVQISENGGR